MLASRFEGHERGEQPTALYITQKVLEGDENWVDSGTSSLKEIMPDDWGRILYGKDLTEVILLMYPSDIDDDLSMPYTIHATLLGPNVWPCAIHLNSGLYLVDKQRRVTKVSEDVRELLSFGYIYADSGPVLSTVFVTDDGMMHISPGTFPISAFTPECTGTLSNDGTLSILGPKVQIFHETESESVVTKVVTMDPSETITFSDDHLFVAIRDVDTGRYKVRKFLLYSRELFDTLLDDSEISEYLEFFRVICESKYGSGDAFCRCANFDGALTREYKLDSDTYASKRLAQSVQCLDNDCIFRKNLQNNIVSVYKLNATNCDVDLTICSSGFNPRDISTSAQVNVINQCGSGSSEIPSFVNNRATGGAVATGVSLVMVGLVCTITILIWIGLRRYLRQKPVK